MRWLAAGSLGLLAVLTARGGGGTPGLQSPVASPSQSTSAPTTPGSAQLSYRLALIEARLDRIEDSLCGK
ncbi:hypothetical protein DWB68_12420 [Galactobacter valiniphilus]|uniref:Uncharacterized protein n=1 Tax=Galactobacter valiniphilus TaxID=2676122 RepID=A0A399JBV8_9MICC|nr:hypothetical protein [Galactobacter valiniphilus]RII41522.1 hypothetical protein DWB68_12420 [Galactobacter valiniphilus]